MAERETPTIKIIGPGFHNSDIEELVDSFGLDLVKVTRTTGGMGEGSSMTVEVTEESFKGLVSGLTKKSKRKV